VSGLYKAGTALKWVFFLSGYTWGSWQRQGWHDLTEGVSWL